MAHLPRATALGSATLASMALLAPQLIAQTPARIQLPRPETEIAERPNSATAAEVSPQLLSDLLAAAGSVRGFAPDFKARTVIVYVATAKGIYRWDRAANVLEPVLEGDHRALTGSPDFVRKAPLNLVYVADASQAGETPASEFESRRRADGIFMGQAVFDLCAKVGLEEVVRAWIDADAFASAVRLPQSQRAVLAQSVGYGLLDGSTVPRLPRFMTDMPQSIPDELLLPDAPGTARSIEPFRSLTRKMTMADVVRRCGIPDEGQGSGVHIFIYHLDDGSIVAIGTGDLKALGYVTHVTRSGGTELLKRK